jgi:hypothetical protein
VLASAILKSDQAQLNVTSLDVQPGDTIDFVVDIIQQLNSDQYLWSPVIRQVDVQSVGESPANQVDTTSTVWDAASDFAGPSQPRLTRWEQLAQVLLMTNEFAFID